jgi:hypothetical protein
LTTVLCFFPFGLVAWLLFGPELRMGAHYHV